MTKTSEKKPRGRPVKKHMPEPIDAEPEDIARVIMQAPPKDDWRYLKSDKPKE